MFTKVFELIKSELFFFIILLFTIVTSLFQNPNLNSIDWKVLASLFNLMLISQALIDQKLLDIVALSVLKKCKSVRKICIAMIITTSILSMLITNDVALLTVVPLTLIIAKKANFNPYKIIVTEAISANIGSSLTPFGNPQNLYLYSFFKIPTLDFFKITSGFVSIGMILLLLFTYTVEDKVLCYEVENIKIRDNKKLIIYSIAFIAVLLSILRLIDYKIITLILFIVLLVIEKKLFKNIDYFLLATFFMFFIMIDNISRMGFIQELSNTYLSSKQSVLFISSILSQFISNVPAAILLSPFTTHYEALLIGVSVGGLGTMIASLANLIAYKLYIKEFKNSIQYQKYFYTINFILFLILLLIILILNLF